MNWLMRWTKKQREHRVACREEERALERLINWAATPAPSTPFEELVDPSMQALGVSTVEDFMVEQALLGTSKKVLDKT